MISIKKQTCVKFELPVMSLNEVISKKSFLPST